MLLLSFILCYFACIVTYFKQLQEYMSNLNYGSLSTITGRYYAMDRDKRYERIKIAYDGMVNGTGEVVSPDHVIDVCHVACHGVSRSLCSDR